MQAAKSCSCLMVWDCGSMPNYLMLLCSFYWPYNCYLASHCLCMGSAKFARPLPWLIDFYSATTLAIIGLWFIDNWLHLSVGDGCVFTPSPRYSKCYSERALSQLWPICIFTALLLTLPSPDYSFTFALPRLSLIHWQGTVANCVGNCLYRCRL